MHRILGLGQHMTEENSLIVAVAASKETLGVGDCYAVAAIGAFSCFGHLNII